MPQGKLKVKAKVPASAKSKKQKKDKGPPISKRSNKPMAPKKQKRQEAQKIKATLTKKVNEAIEEEIRAKALDGKKSLVSKKEKVERATRKKK